MCNLFDNYNKTVNFATDSRRNRKKGEGGGAGDSSLLLVP